MIWSKVKPTSLGTTKKITCTEQGGLVWQPWCTDYPEKYLYNEIWHSSLDTLTTQTNTCTRRSGLLALVH